MELTFPDPQGLDDLRTYVARARTADEDGAIRERFGGDAGPFTVVIDRAGTVARVLERHSSDHPTEVLDEIGRLRASDPVRMEQYEPAAHDDVIPQEKGA